MAEFADHIKLGYILDTVYNLCLTLGHQRPLLTIIRSCWKFIYVYGPWVYLGDWWV